MNNKLIPIATFSFPHEAQIAKANLESAEIPAFIENEHTINTNWLFSNAIGGVRVMVPENYAQKALSILESDFSSDLTSEFGDEEDKCPFCGSTDLKPHTKGKKPAFLVFLLIGFPLFFYQHGLMCNECGKFSKT